MTIAHDQQLAERNTAVLAINVGQPQPLPSQKREVLSGIVKLPVSGPVFLSFTGMTGDGQADLENHGGPDKAVCVYDYSRYSVLEQLMERKLDWGACGENLTVEGCSEDQVRIGDVYELGGALVQVSQPRQPCFKLAARMISKSCLYIFRKAAIPASIFACWRREKSLLTLRSGVSAQTLHP